MHQTNSENSQNETLWVFGTQEQAPGLKLPQAMLMDGNADGIIDAPSSAKPNKKSGSSGGALIWLLALAAVARRRR